MITIGEIIKDLRSRTSCSQRELAQELGVSKTFINNLENEKTEAIEKVNRIINYLNARKKMMNQQEAQQFDLIDNLREKGLTLTNADLISIARDYYQRHRYTVKGYIEEYDSEFLIRRYFRTHKVDEDQVVHEVALQFTYAFMQMLEIQVKKNAECDGVPVSAYKVNRIMALEHHEMIAQDMHDYMELHYGKLRPQQIISGSYADRDRLLNEDAE